MKLQYLRAFIVLVAGLITLILNMKSGKPVTLSLFIVLIVIGVFYVIGTLVVEILQKSMEDDAQQVSEEGDSSENETEQESSESNEETIAFAFDEDEAE